MPLNGEKVEELLSGYLDGDLSQAESAEVERALEDAAVRKRYDELVETREQLRALRDARVQAAPGLSASFAAKVWEQIEAGKVVTKATDPHAPAHSATKEVRSPRKQLLAFSIMLAGAAAVLLFFVNPLLRSPSDPAGNAGNGVAVVDPVDTDVNTTSPFSDPSDIAEPTSVEGLAVDSAGAIDAGKLVSERWRQQAMFTVVADIQLSREAVREDFVANTFKAHGIELQSPVLADADILQALSDSQMTEPPQADTGDALLYFVHADGVDIDSTLQIFTKDLKRIPKMWIDVAFDTPVNQSMLRIVASAGEQFSIDESFAAQVNARRPNGSTAMLTGISPRGKLVSRTTGESSDAQPLATGAVPNGMSTILLLVRLPK